MEAKSPEVLQDKPAKIVWEPSFSVGVAKLDEHHQVMARLINRLADFVRRPGNAGMVAEIVAALGEYADYHFIYEEGLMAEYGFPALEAQQDEHRLFCELIAETRYRMSLGITDDGRLLTYLMDWWRSHILEHDMQYKAFFAARGVR